jgi:hypothetical protein
MAEQVSAGTEKPRKSRSPRWPLVGLACLPVLLAAVGQWVYSGPGADSLQVTRAVAAAPDAWVELQGEKPALSLDQTSFAGQPTQGAVYVHRDGSRNDWIRSGGLPLASPNITFSIVRQHRAKPLIWNVIRNLESIDELRMVQHSYRPVYYALSTRFGELRGVQFDVTADGVRKYCVGFHKPLSNLVFAKGFVCAPDSVDATPERVACLIDRIRLATPADEEAMKASLEPDEARPCGATALDPTVARNNESP